MRNEINELIEQIGGRERLEFLSEYRPNIVKGQVTFREVKVIARALLAVLDDVEKKGEVYSAARKLVKCKGRYHSELNYKALAELFGVKTHEVTPPATSAPDRNQLRELVDMVWNEATESETVPSTADADRIIDKVFHGIVQEHASSRYQSAAPAASAHDGWKLVPVEPTAKMMVAGTLVSEFQEDPAGMYRAMIAAAPSPGGDGG